jgi:hypothetical protein
MMRTWPVIALVVVLSGSAALSGCAYALSGRGNTLPADVRRIGIPQFQNLSNIPELDQLITDAVRLEFRSRGKFTPVPETTGPVGPGRSHWVHHGYATGLEVLHYRVG